MSNETVSKYASYFNHKTNCQCVVCKNVRGEGKGIYKMTKEHKKKISLSKIGISRPDMLNNKFRCGISPWNKGIPNSTNQYWLGKSNKDVIIKHHIDGNHKNNMTSNLMKIKQGEHRSLHFRGYEYLVSIGCVRNYVREFLIKYDINPLINDGKIVHHIDCNRENDSKDNLMYIEDRKMHNKLHQEAYLYIVKINKIKDYFDWFFLRIEKIAKKS
jgi:hypothetical protein